MIYKTESYKIIGACFEVYKDKGVGFLEPVYQECLEIEFDYRGIPYESQKALELTYRGIRLKRKYIPDFVCYGKILLEIKAVSALIDDHRAQILNYLNASKMKLGLLINFGHFPKLEFERIAMTKNFARESREMTRNFQLSESSLWIETNKKAKK